MDVSRTTPPQATYPAGWRALHWATAVAVAALLTAGLWMTARGGAGMPAAASAASAKARECATVVSPESRAAKRAAAQGGFHEDGRGTWGRSTIVAPWGEILGKLDHDEPGVLVADLDLTASDRARAAIPNLKNARPFTGP